MAHKSIYKKNTLFKSDKGVTAKVVQIKKTTDEVIHYRLEITSELNCGTKIWFTEEQLVSGTTFKEDK